MIDFLKDVIEAITDFILLLIDYILNIKNNLLSIRYKNKKVILKYDNKIYIIYSVYDGGFILEDIIENSFIFCWEEEMIVIKNNTEVPFSIVNINIL